MIRNQTTVHSSIAQRHVQSQHLFEPVIHVFINPGIYVFTNSTNDEVLDRIMGL